MDRRPVYSRRRAAPTPHGSAAASSEGQRTRRRGLAVGRTVPGPRPVYTGTPVHRRPAPAVQWRDQGSHRPRDNVQNSKKFLAFGYFRFIQPVASLPALGPWASPSRTGPLAKKYLPAFLTADLCEGNKIIGF